MFCYIEWYEMLKKLSISNFRGFSSHNLKLVPLTILVGRNNAGKSTIVEALRLVSIICSRYKGFNFHKIPDWLDIPTEMRGARPSLKNLNINFRTIFNRYGDPPALIHAIFTTNEEIKIYIGPDEQIHAVILNSDKKPITTRGQAGNTKLPQIGILPQIGPIQQDEKILGTDYVKSSMFSSLSSLHFRNQIKVFYNYFQRFKELAEQSWPGLQVRSFEGVRGFPGDILSLFLRDGDFVSEAGLVGHGLQMWLQTIWFLSLVESNETVILDEPDVYMHADLQRRLIRLLKGRFHQIIIATHSIEIMAEVDAENILVIDRYKRVSRFTTSLPAVQKVIEHIGGVHNIQLARLWSVKKFILVEGNDLYILKRIHNSLYPQNNDPLDIIPHLAIGGWSGWNYVVGSSMFVHSTGTDDIVFYCILDSDYHLQDEIDARNAEAQEKNIQLHIWNKKEIENYLIIPSAIARYINKYKRQNISKITETIIQQKIQEIENSEEIRFHVLNCLANEFLQKDRQGGLPKANKTARNFMNPILESENRQSIIPGKKILSKISNWSKTEFNVSLNSGALASELQRDEIDTEVIEVISSIEDGSLFSAH